MSGSLRIARIAGIEVRVHFSWILIFLLVTFAVAGEVLPRDWSDAKQLAVGAVAALLFFTSVVVHELAHSIVAMRSGTKVSSITLFLLGGVADLEREPISARAELLMAAAGPLTSFVLAGLAQLVRLAAPAALDAETARTIDPVAAYLATVNVAVGIFNLIPGFPLDGGRVLRALIWAIRGDRSAATRVAARGGQIVAWGLGLLGAFIILVIGDAAGLWYIVIAYFLYGMASASLQREWIVAVARGARVRDLMTIGVATADPASSVESVVHELMLPFNLAIVPVVSEGRLLGVVAVEDLANVARERWGLARADEVMKSAVALAVVSPDDPLTAAVERFRDSSPLLVTRDGSFVGLLHPEIVIAYLRTRRALGFAQPSPRSA